MTNIHLSAYYCGIFIRRLFIFLTFCVFHQKLHIILVLALQVQKLGYASEPLGRRPKIKPKGLKSKIKFYLLFRSACTNFSPCLASTEIRRRLRKIKFYLLFRSACTNFVAESLNKRVARRVVWGDPNVRGACPRAGWDYTLWTCWRNCREENGTWCVGTSDADSIREDRIPSWE